MNDWIYDLETFPNIFTFTICNSDGSKMKTFEVSDRKNETEGILSCLRWLVDKSSTSVWTYITESCFKKARMVGFNNLGFDYPILHAIMQEAIAAKRRKETYVIDAAHVYKLAQEQLKSYNGEGFPNTIPDKEVMIKQVDLYKIHHFDNKARSTSLKMLEFNMRSENIEDLPFPVGTVLTFEQMDKLIQYNQHDVKETLKFYHHSLKAIQFREELTKSMGIDVTNANDTKVGKDYFISKLEKAIPGSCYKQSKFGRKLNQSKREYIEIGECLFDYYDFKRPEFQSAVEWFSKQRITETKGVFSDIEEHDLGNLSQYMELQTKGKKFPEKPTAEQIAQFKQEHPLGWVEERKLKSPKDAYSYWSQWKIADSLHVTVDGFRFDFGTGGIHGSLTSSVVKADDEYIIMDADVASMYPNLAIANKVYPEHLTERFCSIYEDVYNKRKGYAKGTPENALMKLALNGVYGDSNNQYSPFYDPKYTMTITINGQLSLCLLAERLMEIEGLTLIQVNTDGVTVKLPRDKEEQYKELCQQWEKDVGLELEYVEYSSMFIRDVNNYIAVKTDGKIKRKGAYEYEDLDWHQDQSSLIIPMAAEAFMVYGKDIEQTIRNHKDKFDFMLRTKVPRNSRLVLVNDDSSETPLQNICRYYPTKNGGKLIKIMPPLTEGEPERRIGIDKDWKVKPCNNMFDFTWDIDYDYYISETKKLIVSERY